MQRSSSRSPTSMASASRSLFIVGRAPQTATSPNIFTAFAPESLEHDPHLPLAHRQVLSAIQPCQSGYYGHNLSPCHSCGNPHRVNHACGNRHCPPWQQHTTPQWLEHPLDKQLPGPHFLLTCTVPEPLRACIRSHPRFGCSPHTARHRRAFHRDRPPGVHWGPAYLGEATAVPPAHPFPCARGLMWFNKDGPFDKGAPRATGGVRG